MATYKNLEHNGTTYEVEHCGVRSLERVVVWTLDDEYVGDVFFNHSQKIAMTELRNGTRMDEHYDEMLNKDHEEIARWIIDRA